MNDPEHGVPHGGAGIVVSSMADCMFWGEDSVRSIWPHYPVNLGEWRSAEEGNKCTNSRVPGCKITASRSHAPSFGSSGWYVSKKVFTSPKLLKPCSVPFLLATIHHFKPVLVSTYVPNPSQSTCHQCKAPAVAAIPHLMLSKGGTLLRLQSAAPFVPFHAAESVEKGYEPRACSAMGKSRAFTIFPSGPFEEQTSRSRRVPSRTRSW